MKIDEIQCVTDLKNGSYSAFAMIYEAYSDRLYGFVLKHLKNRQLAQDIVQDAFMRLWINRKQLNCFGNLQGFIFAIAKYQVIDHFRRQMHEPEFDDFVNHAEFTGQEAYRPRICCSTMNFDAAWQIQETSLAPRT